jgi:plasmid stability protein
MVDIVDIKKEPLLMADILIRGVADDLKKRIDRRANLHGNSLSREITRLIEHALADEESRETLSRERLGTRLSQLIPTADWTDDFVVERDKTDREPPDFS